MIKGYVIPSGCIGFWDALKPSYKNLNMSVGKIDIT